VKPDAEFPLTVDRDAGGLTLTLRRFARAKDKGRGPVALLLHGGNSAGDTFLLPRGGLTAYLVQAGLEVWILDWRTSPRVIAGLLERPEPLGGSLENERRLYALDHAAQEDVALAVREVRRHIGDEELGIVGHCMGGGAASIAVASGGLHGLGVKRLVLSTLGLFYEVPWNGWMKAEDFIVERVPAEDPACRGIDPRTPERWPRAMAKAFGYWPPAWLPSGTSPADRMLQHLTFMFGQPYDAARLDPSISDGDLLQQFGPMHLGLFLHAAELVRRGYAAELGAPDVIDRPRLGTTRGVPVPGHYLHPAHFHEHRVTLLTAAENQLWHRDAMDLMHEWLHSHDVRSEKLTFPGYRIQELFWGARAPSEVYPQIHRALL
jgi:cholesterol oxidase